MIGIRLSVTLLAVILSLMSSGCRARKTPAASTTEGQRYELRGRVVSVDSKAQTVTVSHEDIPGYMEAMTMPFKLKDLWAFDVLKPGDSLNATLVVTSDDDWLEGVVITEQSPAGTAAGESGSEPSPGDAVPDFKLVNQDGRQIHLSQYRGRPLVVTFIYTRCPLPNYCPLMSSNFREIGTELQKSPSDYARAHLLSITIDPEHDSPAVLRNYGKGYAGTVPGFGFWEFAGGSPDEIKAVARYFGLTYWRDGDQIVHALRTAVIGPDGRVFKVYRGNEWKPEEILKDLQSIESSNPDATKG